MPRGGQFSAGVDSPVRAYTSNREREARPRSLLSWVLCHGGNRKSEAIARELLDSSGDRWSHVCLAAKTAQEWAEFSQHGDESVSAAWLHDVGYASALGDSGQHAIDGALI